MGRLSHAAGFISFHVRLICAHFLREQAGRPIALSRRCGRNVFTPRSPLSFATAIAACSSLFPVTHIHCHVRENDSLREASLPCLARSLKKHRLFRIERCSSILVGTKDPKGGFQLSIQATGLSWLAGASRQQGSAKQRNATQRTQRSRRSRAGLLPNEVRRPAQAGNQRRGARAAATAAEVAATVNQDRIDVRRWQQTPVPIQPRQPGRPIAHSSSGCGRPEPGKRAGG